MSGKENSQLIVLRNEVMERAPQRVQEIYQEQVMRLDEPVRGSLSPHWMYHNEEISPALSAFVKRVTPRSVGDVASQIIIRSDGDVYFVAEWRAF